MPFAPFSTTRVTDPNALAVGSKVTLRALENDTEYNGCKATVMALYRQAEKASIRLDSGSEKGTRLKVAQRHLALEVSGAPASSSWTAPTRFSTQSRKCAQDESRARRCMREGTTVCFLI